MSKENTREYIIQEGIMLACFTLSREAEGKQLKALRKIHKRIVDVMLPRRDEFIHYTTPDEVIEVMGEMLDELEGKTR